MKDSPRQNALQPLPYDSRDFSHSTVFGSIAANDLPTEDFLVAVPIEMKNQDINYPSDYCTSYAAAEAAEDEDQVIFVPEWTFAWAKALVSENMGVDTTQQFGLNLRDVCEGGRQFGFLPRHEDPFHCDTANRPSRDILVNVRNWPVELTAKAALYKKSSYFIIDGPHDTFDNIRAALAKNLPYRRTAIVGCLWRQSWSSAVDGIIPETYEAIGGGHAFKICGQKTINGVLYLIAQMSDGEKFGDKGYCYFSRSVVNREFTPYGAFMFNNMPKEQAQWYHTRGVSVYDRWYSPFARLISKYISI